MSRYRLINVRMGSLRRPHSFPARKENSFSVYETDNTVDLGRLTLSLYFQVYMRRQRTEVRWRESER